nr:UPF0149 family protein [Caulobacter zeae]
MSPEPADLSPELEILDAFLSSEEVPETALLLSELDGFLTGLAVGPELVMPAEWLPHVWGGAEPNFRDGLEAQKIVGAIMRRYDDIRRRLETRTLEPILLETEAGEVLASDWADGFLLAVSLRYAAWDKLMSSERRPSADAAPGPVGRRGRTAARGPSRRPPGRARRQRRRVPAADRSGDPCLLAARGLPDDLEPRPGGTRPAPVAWGASTRSAAAPTDPNGP